MPIDVKIYEPKNYMKMFALTAQISLKESSDWLISITSKTFHYRSEYRSKRKKSLKQLRTETQKSF